MTIFEITIDTSIEGAITRIIHEELGKVSVQIICEDKSKYKIEIDKKVSVDDAQRTRMHSQINQVFENEKKIISSAGWKS